MIKKMMLACVLTFGLAIVALGQTYDNTLGTGMHHFFSGRHLEAIQAFDAAIQIDPNDARSYYYRGLAKWRTGDSSAANTDFRMGAQIEAGRNNRSSVVTRSLERIQGFERLEIEQARTDALNPGELFVKNSIYSGSRFATNPSTVVETTVMEEMPPTAAPVDQDQTFTSQSIEIKPPVAEATPDATVLDEAPTLDTATTTIPKSDTIAVPEIPAPNPTEPTLNANNEIVNPPSEFDTAPAADPSTFLEDSEPTVQTIQPKETTADPANAILAAEPDVSAKSAAPDEDVNPFGAEPPVTTAKPDESNPLGTETPVENNSRQASETDPFGSSNPFGSQPPAEDNSGKASESDPFGSSNPFDAANTQSNDVAGSSQNDSPFGNEPAGDASTSDVETPPNADGQPSTGEQTNEDEQPSGVVDDPFGNN